MSKMNLRFRVVNSNYNQFTRCNLEQCYDHLKMITEFAENYGMPSVKLKLAVEGNTADYILVSFQTDLVADVYVKVLKDLLHIVQSYELSDCCYQISPI